MNRYLKPALALTLLAACVTPALAAWPHDPNSGNVVVSAAANDQVGSTIVSDGAGGVVIAWYDFRSGTTLDIYAQRISAAGVPQWAANGVLLCSAANDQGLPRIISDGAGGAIVIWEDYRSGATSDVYAQRISAGGVVQWTANGVAVCTATGAQSSISAVADGSGGAVVTWTDTRSGTGDIYAQRISSLGASQWTVNGLALCTAANGQSDPKIAPDGAGGAIVTWYDLRSAANYDIYAQRINAAGVAQWTANGVLICGSAADQLYPAIVLDGAGGAIVTWQDFRSGTSHDIYAQRISASGVTQWTGSGVALCTVTDFQGNPVIASDGSGGAIVAWIDLRSVTNYDIYAQRVGAGGSAQWTANGVALCTSVGNQTNPTIVSDGGGGVIVAWQDARGGVNNDIYAQRISGGGSNQWTANGVAYCTAPGSQQDQEIASDGAGGAIVTWIDLRTMASFDIYAQRAERYGQLGNPEPVITGVKDVKNDQGARVKLSWAASYLDVDPTYGVTDYRIWRSVPSASLTTQALLQRGAAFDADEAAAGNRYLIRPYASIDYAWELVGSQASAVLPNYSLTAATSSDSIAGSNPRTVFMVEARQSTSLTSDRWFSAPDSGYSVDNLPPAAPAPFTGQYAAGTTTLHWNRNTEADLAGYRLHRGSSVAFVPGPGNFVSALPDTGTADAPGSPYVYKLTAVDSHGNESPVATLIPSGTTGVEDGAPLALSFAAPSPNPTRGAATLRYTLSRAGHVRLAVYDAAGRRVATLHDGEQEAGAHEASFALRDAGGRGLASGLYLLQLQAEGRVLTRRLATIR